MSWIACAVTSQPIPPITPNATVTVSTIAIVRGSPHRISRTTSGDSRNASRIAKATGSNTSSASRNTATTSTNVASRRKALKRSVLSASCTGAGRATRSGETGSSDVAEKHEYQYDYEHEA